RWEFVPHTTTDIMEHHRAFPHLAIDQQPPGYIGGSGTRLDGVPPSIASFRPSSTPSDINACPPSKIE
ncbi:MAG: hypothetical protein MUQ10_19620, partial [Anaerolineae bacterium]|nr:hypothetical protein [Anaerolineae bacterium]